MSKSCSKMCRSWGTLFFWYVHGMCPPDCHAVESAQFERAPSAPKHRAMTGIDGERLNHRANLTCGACVHSLTAHPPAAPPERARIPGCVLDPGCQTYASGNHRGTSTYTYTEFCHSQAASSAGMRISSDHHRLLVITNRTRCAHTSYAWQFVRLDARRV